jgi:hypothetical protein
MSAKRPPLASHFLAIFAIATGTFFFTATNAVTSSSVVTSDNVAYAAGQGFGVFLLTWLVTRVPGLRRPLAVWIIGGLLIAGFGYLTTLPPIPTE